MSRATGARLWLGVAFALLLIGLDGYIALRTAVTVPVLLLLLAPWVPVLALIYPKALPAIVAFMAAFRGVAPAAPPDSRPPRTAGPSDGTPG